MAIAAVPWPHREHSDKLVILRRSRGDDLVSARLLLILAWRDRSPYCQVGWWLGRAGPDAGSRCVAGVPSWRGL